MEFEKLRALSAEVGSNLDLVQAAGGNTSLKRDGLMWIKASGTWLRDAASQDIFVPLDFAALQAGLAADDPDCESCVKFVRGDLNPSGLRPSIETSVHGLMPQAVVVHVHCVNTISWAIRSDAELWLAENLMGESWVFVPYARPGLQLSKAIKQRLVGGVNVLVLGNHGLVVAADTVAEARILLDRIVEKLRVEARPCPTLNLAAMHKALAGSDYVPAPSPDAHALALDEMTFRLGRAKIYYPDHVVFLGTEVPTDFASGAPAVVIPHVGVALRKDAKPSIEPMLVCIGSVLRRIEAGAKLKSLTHEEIGQLLNWDAEKYRQTIKT